MEPFAALVAIHPMVRCRHTQTRTHRRRRPRGARGARGAPGTSRFPRDHGEQRRRHAARARTRAHRPRDARRATRRGGRDAAVPQPARCERRAVDHPRAPRRRSGPHPRARDGRRRLPGETREFRANCWRACAISCAARTAPARTGPAARARLFRFGGWQLDSVARELCDPQGSPRRCATPSTACSSSLLAHGNRVVSRGKLIELARGRDAGPFDRSIDVRISRLRQVLGDDARVPRIIKTVHGEGYVIGVLVERA